MKIVDTFKQEYNKRIYELAEDKELNMKKLSKETKTNYSNNMKKLKEESRYWSIDDLIAICEITKLSPEYILGFTNEKKELIITNEKYERKTKEKINE